MALPININELINGKTVEWERIEFREGRDPERIIRAICAFANDFNNWSGGYIVIGIAEHEGKPLLPPTGLESNKIDSIQKQLNQICRRILPNYFPIAEPVDYLNKKILILWCPGGNARPYKAPESFTENPRYFYYIRRFSSTVKPNSDEELTYFKISFDVHHLFSQKLTKKISSSKKSSKNELSNNQVNLYKIKDLEEILLSLVHIAAQEADYVKIYTNQQIDQAQLKRILKVLSECNIPQSRSKILSMFGKANNTRNYQNYILLLMSNGLLEMTILNKPKSPNQKYRTTDNGKRLLEILK